MQGTITALRQAQRLVIVMFWDRPFDRLRDRLKIIQYGALRQAQAPQLTHNSTATSLRLAMISQGAL